jgi:hypothetical protein
VNKDFGPSLLANTFKKVFEELSIPLDALSITANYDHGSPGEERKDISFSELENISKIGGHIKSVGVSFRERKEDIGKYNHIILQTVKGLLLLNCALEKASFSNPIFEIFENNLNLEKSGPEKVETIDIFKLETRVANLESEMSKKSEATSCFLSYRFNEQSKPLAFELSKFLDLLGIKVISGMGYEPRRVTEKVMSRLKNQHDFFIYLITSEGESTWTRDELAYAFATELPVILLVEKGASVGKGLLGDWEYIEFERSHIGDTYIAILEATKFIKSQKEG